MKKKAYLLALGIVVLGLSGCGKDADKETETKKETVVATTEKATETVKETEKVTEKQTETEKETETETETKKRRTKKEEKETGEVIDIGADDKKEATLENAKPYVGKTLAELSDAIGVYKSFETAGACLEDENELNGIAHYDNFTVYCHSVEGQTKWIIDAIE